MGTGAGIALLAGGAILRFAVATTSTHGLNVHVVGVILMLAGALGLALSLLVWGPLSPARRRHNGSGGYEAGAPPLAEDRRLYQASPGAGERQPYRDQPPPGAEERPLYRDQRPQ